MDDWISFLYQVSLFASAITKTVIVSVPRRGRVCGWVGLQNNMPTHECFILKFPQYVGMHHGLKWFCFGDDLS